MKTVETKEDNKSYTQKVTSLQSAKRLLSRIISDYQKDVVSTEKAKTLTYLLINFVAISKDIDFESKLSEMENKLGIINE
jgi:hypothetical protein